LTLRVAVDCWCLGGTAAQRGVGTYVRSVLPGLAADPALQVVALTEAGVELPPGADRHRVHRHAPPRWALAEHRLRLPLDMRRSGAAVVWEPTPDPPAHSKGPWVQTLHDVIPLVLDDADLAEERDRWKRYIARYRSADAVIAVSRFSADEGIRVLDLDPRRVHVCHHGVGEQFRPSAGEKVQPPYLLVVNEWSERKGYAEAFAVIAALADAGLPHVLRVAGFVAPWKRERIEGLRRAAARPERVELLGYVDDLPALYQGATALLSTSRYEGFGLPVLEAMACGVPVVAFANSAVPEVVGDGGVLVPDGDVGAMTREALRVANHADWADELAHRGIARAHEFSWAQSAKTHAEIIRSVA
jgi:glycosyltransferase involved in cell wall biosynthesis